MTMRPRNGYFLLFGLAAALASPAMAGVEKPVELSAVPASVMEVAKTNVVDLKVASGGDAAMNADDDSVVDDDGIVAAYEILGDVNFVSANTETEEDGSYVFEIQGTFADGRKIEIDIFPDGEVEEIEIEFKLADVPGAILKAIERKLPGFKHEFIEASHNDAKKVTGYEFVGMMGETKMDIEVSADGRNIVVSDQ